MRILVRAVGSQRVEGIPYGNDSRQQRDLFVLEAMRIAPAIKRLMVQLNAGNHFLQLCYRAKNVGAFSRVGLHDFKFFGGQSARLFQNAVLNSDFADIVQLRGDT